MSQRLREKMMKKATERKLRKRWSFFDRVFRQRKTEKRQASRPEAFNR